jgi:hypothetical protein
MSETKAKLLDAGETILTECEALQREGPPTPAQVEALSRLTARLGEVTLRLMSGCRDNNLTEGEKFRLHMILAGYDQLRGNA